MRKRKFIAVLLVPIILLTLAFSLRVKAAQPDVDFVKNKLEEIVNSANDILNQRYVLGRLRNQFEPILDQLRGLISYLSGENIVNPIYDIDGDGMVVTSTDAILISRYLSGFRDNDLIKGIHIGDTAKRKTASQIQEYLDTLDDQMLLDADGNRSSSALTDGILIFRYIEGLRGNALIKDAVSKNAKRKTAQEIVSFLDSAFIKGRIIGGEKIEKWAGKRLRKPDFLISVSPDSVEEGGKVSLSWHVVLPQSTIETHPTIKYSIWLGSVSNDLLRYLLDEDGIRASFSPGKIAEFVSDSSAHRSITYEVSIPKTIYGEVLPGVTGDTRILMANGTYKRIKDIKPGDKVVTFINPGEDKIPYYFGSMIWFGNSIFAAKIRTATVKKVFRSLKPVEVFSLNHSLKLSATGRVYLEKEHTASLSVNPFEWFVSPKKSIVQEGVRKGFYRAVKIIPRRVEWRLEEKRYHVSFSNPYFFRPNSFDYVYNLLLDTDPEGVHGSGGFMLVANGYVIDSLMPFKFWVDSDLAFGKISTLFHILPSSQIAEEIKSGATPSTCIESDNGLDYYTKGYVVFRGKKYYDECSSNGFQLEEKVCHEDGSMSNIVYDCPYGCFNGACIKENIRKKSSPCLPLGDIDDDGFISVKDASLIINLSLKAKPTAEQLKRADVNGDGKINVLDFQTVISYLLGGRNNFPGCNTAPSLVAYNCSDNDGGRNYYHFGKVVLKDKEGKILDIKEDKCVDQNNLLEYFCQKDSNGALRIASENYKCLNGCSNGACRRRNVVFNKGKLGWCWEGIDGGNNPYLGGTTILVEKKSYTSPPRIVEKERDVCIDKNTLKEFWCTIGNDGKVKIESASVSCPYGCENGACKLNYRPIFSTSQSRVQTGGFNRTQLGNLLDSLSNFLKRVKSLLLR